MDANEEFIFNPGYSLIGIRTIGSWDPNVSRKSRNSSDVFEVLYL